MTREGGREWRRGVVRGVGAGGDRRMGPKSSLGRRILGRAWEVGRGRFPLGGGNDEERGAAGMTGKRAAGMTGKGAGVTRKGAVEVTGGGGAVRLERWRRDTRGKRGYDGVGARAWRERGLEW